MRTLIKVLITILFKLLILALIFPLPRLFRNLHSTTLQLCTFRVASFLTFRSVLLSFDSRLVQFVGYGFQPVEICKKCLLCWNQFQRIIQVIQNCKCGVVNFDESYNAIAEIIGIGIFDFFVVYGSCKHRSLGDCAVWFFEGGYSKAYHFFHCISL